MKYNPDIHNRRSIRLKDYDYSQAGAYFVTICMQNRDCRLGQIRNGIVGLSKAGLMVYRVWFELEARYDFIHVDEFIVMPNHVHGIMVIDNPKRMSNQNVVGSNDNINKCRDEFRRDKPRRDDSCRDEPCVHPDGEFVNEEDEHKVHPYGGGAGLEKDEHKVHPYGTLDGSLGRVIQGFKSITTVEYGKGVKNAGWPAYNRKLWQMGYYDHIIRCENELNRIREYIIYNPLKWVHDPENPDAEIKKPEELWQV